MSRIALISDIHFGEFSRSEEFAVPGSNIKDETKGGESLQQGLIEILKREQIEYIFIAGDLTSIGSPQEFHYCEKKIIEITEAAHISTENVICCLGNHDVDRKIAALSDQVLSSDVSKEIKDIVMEKYQLIASSSAQSCCNLLVERTTEGVAPFSGIIERDDFVAIILNSSWQCSQHQTTPHGKLTKNQLEWFEKISKAYKTDIRKKIVLMHHHPIQYSYPTIGLDISMIEEGSELIDIAGKNGISMILHGHRHHARATTMLRDGWGAPITFICAGSLAVNAEHRSYGDIPNTMHIVEFTKDNERIELYNYQFTRAQGWTPFEKYCPETPLDAHMVLGKVYDEKSQVNAIMNYKNYEGRIEWTNLDESLQCINYRDLNEKFSLLLSPTHDIFDHFPKPVMLIKKGGV